VSDDLEVEELSRDVDGGAFHGSSEAHAPRIHPPSLFVTRVWLDSTLELAYLAYAELI
jgi:hypothetical protein